MPERAPNRCCLLDPTTRILIKDDYDKVSTNKIALVVSVGSLYQYFPSKEAVVAVFVHCHM
jgi:AcrR family transcriptional regulator